MFLAVLTLVTALTISAVAIYYSVAGLVAIFAAAAVPIIIMGGALEVGKLVTAVWLHKYWDRANWWLRTYLGLSVIILMFITSMGIFGFLSKAHIEQTATAGEGVAQIERIDEEIARQRAVIERAEIKIQDVQTSGTGADVNIQAQIDREQARIDTAYNRIQPAIDSTNQQLESDKEFFLRQLPELDEKLARLDDMSNIDTTDEEAVKRLQALVGARPDGAYGGGTARAVRDYREGLQADRDSIFAKVEKLKAAAQEEIARLRGRAESEIDDSNALIGRLRSQLGQTTGEDIGAVIQEQNQRISQANSEMDQLVEEKFQLEAEYRKLEAEVGPIKYIAEFIYGDEANKNMLEEAVRWVIIVIIFVFDPLAVLLLIASQYTFNWTRQDRASIREEITPQDSEETGESGASQSHSGEYHGNNEETEPELVLSDTDTDTGERDTEVEDTHSLSDQVHTQPIIVYPEPEELNSVEIDDLDDEPHVVMVYEETVVDNNEPNADKSKFAILPDLEDAIQEARFEDDPNYSDLGNGYVQYNGKVYAKEAFSVSFKDIVARPDIDIDTNVDFGTRFPEQPTKGDLFLRVDHLPTKLYKYNGSKWIEVDKDQNTSILNDDSYIELLIDKLADGTYEPDMLSDHERDIVEKYLTDKGEK